MRSLLCPLAGVCFGLGVALTSPVRDWRLLVGTILLLAGVFLIVATA